MSTLDVFLGHNRLHKATMVKFMRAELKLIKKTMRAQPKEFHYIGAIRTEDPNFNTRRAIDTL